MNAYEIFTKYRTHEGYNDVIPCSTSSSFPPAYVSIFFTQVIERKGRMFHNTFGRYENCECGLVTVGTEERCRPIPLTRVAVDVTWLDLGILVTIAQTFKNNETK